MKTQRYKKVLLVNPPVDSTREVCVDAGYWQPLNLIALGSHLLACGYQGEIQILDQEVDSAERVDNEVLSFRPDIVGISPNLDSYQSCLDIARLAKSIGSDVVLGGNYATTLAKNILINRAVVDYVVMSDGEVAFKDLVMGLAITKVSNLAYRNVFGVQMNTVYRGEKATYTTHDYSLVDLDPYFANYMSSRNPGPFSRPASIVSQRGCVWKDKTGGCVFCSRETGSKFDDVKEVWAKISELKCEYSVDSIMDTGDDFLGNQNWFRDFYENRPTSLEDFGIRFIYSRVNHVNKENARKLKDLNTFEVFLGLESGNQKILRNTIKGNSITRQLEAVSNLEEQGIGVALGFVIGLPGETEETLRDTSEHIDKLLEFTNINEIIVSVMTPLQGSPSYNTLLSQPQYHRKYSRADVFELEEIQHDWIDYQCHTNRSEMMSLAYDLSRRSAKVVREFNI